jgi:ABC-type spermidine/putrescine transport system permease subunit II
VLPGVLGAAVFVFAEMLGSFSAALVLGLPSRFYVVTTAMYQMVSQYPPRFPTAAAMGVSLFAVMFVMVWIYRRIVSAGSYGTITGKAFRPRVMDVRGLRWPLLSLCVAYLGVSVMLPVLTIVYASFQRLTTLFPRRDNFTLANCATALSLDAVRSALWNSLLLGFATASIGVFLMGFLSWLIYRSRLPGAGAIEYLLMFPQAVPRLVFAFGMLWAWLVFPIPIYGTLWLLLIAYLTVFLPLGLRTISGVILQIDRSPVSVFDNVAYGLRVRKRPETEVATRVNEALDLVQLHDLGARSASRLSGGQQQRVALARAFVFSPSVLLFDEPLSNLDAKLRAEMRVELKELQRRFDITSVYVTHDLEEALAISDRAVSRGLEWPAAHRAHGRVRADGRGGRGVRQRRRPPLRAPRGVGTRPGRRGSSPSTVTGEWRRQIGGATDDMLI